MSTPVRAIEESAYALVMVVHVGTAEVLIAVTA